MLVFVDPAAGPETSMPLRCFPIKGSCETIAASRIAAAVQLCAEERAGIVAVADGLAHKNRRWIEKQFSAAKKALSPSVKFDERLLCLTYADDEFASKRRGFATSPDFELVYLYSVSEFFALKARDREETVGGRKSYSRRHDDLRMWGPQQVPAIDLGTKTVIWQQGNGFSVNVGHMKDAGKVKQKKCGLKRWNNILTLQHPVRDLAFLKSFTRDLSIHLLIVMMAGNASSAMSMLSRELSEHNISTLILVNNPEHQEYCEKVMDSWILQAMQTPGHPLHNEVIEGQIREAFPALQALSVPPADDDAPRSCAEDDESKSSDDDEPCRDDDDDE